MLGVGIFRLKNKASPSEGKLSTKLTDEGIRVSEQKTAYTYFIFLPSADPHPPLRGTFSSKEKALPPTIVFDSLREHSACSLFFPLFSKIMAQIDIFYVIYY